jgi:hypothetical protein
MYVVKNLHMIVLSWTSPSNSSTDDAPTTQHPKCHQHRPQYLKWSLCGEWGGLGHASQILSVTVIALQVVLRRKLKG